MGIKPAGSYDFHGFRLECRAEQTLLEALSARFGRFPSVEASAAPDVRFEFRHDPPEEGHRFVAAGDARVVYESPMGEVLYGEADDRMWIRTVWPIRAMCDPVAGRTTTSVLEPLDAHLWALSHPLLTLPLIEMLKRRERYSLHAAGVARGSRSLLIPGSSGSGKSTLALALARAGFDFLGDDMLFLRRHDAGLEALAFPEAFDLTDATVRLFPDLADVLESDKLPGWPKHQLRAEERFGVGIAWRSQPVALVFPRVAHAAESTLTEMEPAEALLELVPNILLTEAKSSQQHLDALSELVSSCHCYRLHTGTDFDALTGRLGELLEAQA